MNIEVSSPGRKEQKLSQTAGAVYVITQEDIRRSGATSIPEVLRLAPGIQVAQIDANMWAVTSRGFNGRFADKMLVLIDGRSIYNNLYSGVYWDENDVPLEDIERIEVIRGPGATMWGANAVNGVINIITKPAKETQGVQITTGAGNEEHASALLRYGGKVGEGVFYRASAQYFNDGPFAGGEGPAAHDRWDSARGSARLDWKISERDSLTVEGDVYRGGEQQSVYPNYPYTYLSPAVGDAVGISGGFGLARWSRRVSDRSDLALQFSYSEDHRAEGFGQGVARVADLDFQHHFALSARHDLMWGLGFRVFADATESRRTFAPPSAVASLVPASSADPLASFFVQDQIALLPDRVSLTLGTKLEHNVYTGFETQPSIRLLWTPTPQQGIWASVSRAVRTPARADRDVSIQFQITAAPGLLGVLSGNPDFRSETALAYEAGYRTQPVRWMTLDLAAFFCHYDHLRTFDVGAPLLGSPPEPVVVVPIEFGNLEAGHTYGLELATNWSLNSRWRVSANYSWFQFALARHFSPDQIIPTDVEGAAPAHQVQFRSQLDLGRKVTFDTGLYFVSALAGIGVPAYGRTDARLGWRLTPALDISLAAQNLLDGRHLEFIANDYVQSSEPGRAAYLKATWSF